jgi:Lrp/AsnC family transcriptional regulator, leucine-responsive regulatory protein
MTSRSPAAVAAAASATTTIDRAIIGQLVADGRLSNVELAERVRLSPSACLRRTRALERSGVIRGYHADIDPAAIGRGFE